MALLWVCIVGAGLLCGAAGVRALWLMEQRDAAIARLQLSVDTLRGDQASAKLQLDAQRILLGQAEAWMKAQKPDAGPAATP